MPPTDKQHNKCVVLLTHRMDEPMVRYLRYLQGEITEVMDFCVLYDCGTQPLDPADYPDLRFHLFNSNDMPGFFHGGHPRLPSPLLPLLEFAQETVYKYYLVMEGDLVFTGGWRDFARRMGGLACDYVHIATDVNKDPRHWPVRYIKEFPFPRLYFAWCHLFYISYRYLSDLGEFMKENASIYYEFLLPSMAYCNGYYVRQFENFGYRFEVSYGPAEVYERKYLEEHTDNTFYHPVKNSGLIKY